MHDRAEKVAEYALSLYGNAIDHVGFDGLHRSLADEVEIRESHSLSIFGGQLVNRSAIT
jgi:hypothetical protein